MAKKDFNKRITIEIDGKEFNRSRVCMKPVDKIHDDGTPIVIMNDRVYIRNSNGSLKSLKNKVSKKERRLAREHKAAHSFPMPGQTVAIKGTDHGNS